jgi:hypothetical protein
MGPRGHPAPMRLAAGMPPRVSSLQPSRWRNPEKPESPADSLVSRGHTLLRAPAAPARRTLIAQAFRLHPGDKTYLHP